LHEVLATHREKGGAFALNDTPMRHSAPSSRLAYVDQGLLGSQRLMEVHIAENSIAVIVSLWFIYNTARG
jgi:hypothetical protein